MGNDLAPLNSYAVAPTIAAQGGLESPFEEVKHQDREAIDKLALLGFAHAFDFLGDMKDIRLRELARTQQGRLLVGPGIKVAFV